ncbi:hypothetical protein D3C71_1969650 [compost metagenome]
MGAPWRASRSFLYRPLSSHSLTQPGSRLGRSPRIGKGVSGMFRVARYAEAFSAWGVLSDIETFKAKHGPDPAQSKGWGPVRLE